MTISPKPTVSKPTDGIHHPNHEPPIIPSERQDDLHGLQWADRADLVLFMAGNQFMVMPELINAFQDRNPHVAKIYYETLPPGLELRQILAGCALFKGQRLSVYPDVYSSVSLAGMQTLEARGHIATGAYGCYLHNRLTLMVPAGNPAHITRVEDLGRTQVRISQPDPANEDIAFHIMAMYRQAGGEALVQRIMSTKREQGTTRFTTVHHRETPALIGKKQVDVGPVWASEAQYAATTDLAFEVVAPGNPLDQREHINYYICRTIHGRHPENGALFINFIHSKEAQHIFNRHGFVPS